MSIEWEKQVDFLIEHCDPAGFQSFIASSGEEVADLDEEQMWTLIDLYKAGPLTVLGSAILTAPFESEQVPSIALQAGLERLWAATIDNRDTSQLDEAMSGIDDVWVEQLEDLRQIVEGMLTIIDHYATDDLSPEPDVNALIHQSVRLAASNLKEARQLLGRAGAAGLCGAHYWPLWPSEIETLPASNWLLGLQALRLFAGELKLYPLAPIDKQRVLWRNREEALSAQGEAQPKFEEKPLSPDQQRLMKVLLNGREKLNDKQRSSLPKFSPEVLEQLIYVLTSEEYAVEESSGKGYAPIHAATLLGESKAPEAVEPLLMMVHNSDIEDILHSTAILALGKLGKIALPVLLETMQYSTDLDLKDAVVQPLAQVGKGDEQAFRALEAFYEETTWAENRMLAVMALAELGDERGLPLLYKSLKSDRDIVPMGIREIAGAIKSLETVHNPAELEQLVDKAYKRYDNQHVRIDLSGQAVCKDCGGLMQKGMFDEWQHVEDKPGSFANQRPTPPIPNFPLLDPLYKNVGRNDPCPCGSGKKFKHCHGAAKPTVH